MPLVILTGAGISRESGLSTFRDADGIWATVNIEDVATPEAYARDPEKVQAFYNARRAGLQEASVKPNPAHEALARLERHWPGPVLVVTQNIDNLHERAGSRNVLHMHGELLKVRCEACAQIHDWTQNVTVETTCPSCDSTGQMRPHVVWFGEMPFDMEEILEQLARCGMFISIGTSGSVYPAAGFCAMVRDKGDALTVEINLEPSEGASFFEEARYGPASREVPAFVEEMLSLAGITNG